MASFILEAISNFILSVIAEIGYSGIFLLMFFQSMNVPIPSEITMPFSGFLASRGVFNFRLVVLTGAFANLAGALVSYKLASLILNRGLREKCRLLRFLINDNILKSTERWFAKYGAVFVFFARLIPVFSTFISFPAGLAKINLLIFSALTFAGSLIWSWFLTYLGFVLGENWTILERYFREFDYLIVILIIAALVWWLWRHIRFAQNQKLKIKNQNE